MVWQDEFDGKRPDTNKWNVLIRETSKHLELQYYVPDEVYIENGLLRIRSRIRKYGSKDYTSGRLSTDGIPHAPHYLILNTAVGGSWPGNPDSTTTFPQYHDIDYVRVFQKKPYFE
jgi:beta-glucanase (GH16 family)